MFVVSSRSLCRERGRYSGRHFPPWKQEKKSLGRREKCIWVAGGDLVNLQATRKWSWKSFVREAYNGTIACLLWPLTANSLQGQGRWGIRQIVKRGSGCLKSAFLLIKVRGVKIVSLFILNGSISINKLTFKNIHSIYGIMLMMYCWISSTSGNRKVIVIHLCWIGPYVVQYFFYCRELQPSWKKKEGLISIIFLCAF